MIFINYNSQIFSNKLRVVFRITFKVTDVLRLRIRACVARPATAKCGGAKCHKGRKPDWRFAEPEPPEQGGEQLLFVMCRKIFSPFYRKCTASKKIIARLCPHTQQIPYCLINIIR